MNKIFHVLAIVLVCIWCMISETRQRQNLKLTVLNASKENHNCDQKEKEVNLDETNFPQSDCIRGVTSTDEAKERSIYTNSSANANIHIAQNDEPRVVANQDETKERSISTTTSAVATATNVEIHIPQDDEPRVAANQDETKERSIDTTTSTAFADANAKIRIMYTIPETIPNDTNTTSHECLGNQIHIVNNYTDPLLSCSPTSQVRLERHEGGDDEWILHSIDEHGKDKKIGGDEFYVTLTYANSIAVALIRDRNDGTYALDFVSVPDLPHVVPTTDFSGTLLVHFVYTCGIGFLAPPEKDAWTGGGSCGLKHQVNVTDVTQFSIRSFQFPKRVWEYKNSSVDLSQFDWTISYGDSLSWQLVSTKVNRHGVHQPKTESYSAKGALSSLTVQSFLDELEEGRGPILRNTSMHVALVIGSALWDILHYNNIQGPFFEDHLQACRDFATAVRSAYPNVTVIWKSPTAIHLHVMNDLFACYGSKNCRDREKYGSYSRGAYLHEQQKRLMDELNIPYLDIYEASYLSAHLSRYNDIRHYKVRLFEWIHNWFWKGSKDLVFVL